MALLPWTLPTHLQPALQCATGAPGAYLRARPYLREQFERTINITFEGKELQVPGDLYYRHYIKEPLINSEWNDERDRIIGFKA